LITVIALSSLQFGGGGDSTLESLVKRAPKPNKKITTASQLLPVHGLLSNVFGPDRVEKLKSSEQLSKNILETLREIIYLFLEAFSYHLSGVNSEKNL
jgi:hypothetical protein